ncbi:hypothetical protein TEA_006616 [Camellia sinensis var. sinensis]|uniref:TF-B3 domain-containing protein n=1 Tax=Camellia sinensis var. sinensis TaxID=542762 RepID=A0A4S4E5X9_CAMSN|nr:hypothetical protein TEA_006616 [Camellia sinensis var. sinensis]
MSESSDEEGKSMNNSDNDEEEEEYYDDEEKKADDGNQPLKRQKGVHFTESSDQRRSDVMSESELRQPSRRGNNELQQGRTRAKKENFLFEVQLSLSNLDSSTITIPWETTEKYFLVADTGTHQEINLQFSDKYTNQWRMALSFSPQPGADLVIGGWLEYFGAHNLKAMDLLRFYKPLPQPFHIQKYLLGYLAFLFKKNLTTTDVSQKLVIPIGAAENHFPRLITNKPSSAMLQISDAQNKKWEMKFHVAPVANQSTQNYGYKMDWTEFVTKHKLEAYDVIFFYKPVLPSEDNHYAIRFKRPSKKDDRKKGSPSYSRKNQPRKMSESSDEEGKSMKNSDNKEEEKYDAEEEYDDEAERKADDVNPPSTKQKHVDLESCDKRSRNVTPKSKGIKSSMRVDNKEDDFVFEVQLSLTDFQSQKLTIPWETVEKYFLNADTRTQLVISVLLTDKYNNQKHERCSFSPQPGGDFIITEWSRQFSAHKAMDLIRFYRPLPQPFHNQHYLVGYLKFLFEKTLTTTDVSQNLVIPIKAAENHFPRLITSKPSHAMLQIFDAQNKKWEMKFHVAPVANQNAQKYGYKLDWTEFVTKHKLEAGNVIFFYKPVLPSEDNHYAIRFKRPSKKDDSKKGGNKDIHPEN